MRNCHIGIFIGAMYPVLEWGGMQAGDSSECCSHASRIEYQGWLMAGQSFNIDINVHKHLLLVESTF